MSVRVRFAPSPTGQVHIGNIRAAIFNWLFARHHGGQFLLRIEDTDRERSTQEAVTKLLEVMTWLGLNYDEPPVYQTAELPRHQAAAAKLLASGQAYLDPRGDGPPVTVFRLPAQPATCPLLRAVGVQELELHPELPFKADQTGIRFAIPSSKGKPVEREVCLGGLSDAKVYDAQNALLADLSVEMPAILTAGKTLNLAGAVRVRFTRYEVVVADLVKGALAKPLDSMKDLVLVRGDGTPVFHLANVVDDITMRITHIVRGDDHVENTYRHVLMFHALGQTPPVYAHLPMIVNANGKPYSKRDGDAYVGDFRDKGYLPEALFNYLTLLGWSPGNDVEKLSRAETVTLFDLARVKSSPAQMDLDKLFNLNGLYMTELPPAQFAEQARAHLAGQPWLAGADPAFFSGVSALMQTRTKLWSQVSTWGYFFTDDLAYDEAEVAKHLCKDGVKAVLETIAGELDTGEFTAAAIEAAIHAGTSAHGLKPGRMNMALRLAVTACGVGAGLYETMELLGRPRTQARLRYSIEQLCV